ncbi:MAG: GFA family protein [Pseudomonadales bacterium]
MSTASGAAPLPGRCSCGAIRFEITAPPMFVHGCHCTWCQRETGTAFAINALVESAHVAVRRGTPELVTTPSASGRGQRIARCPACRVALWSHYAGMGEAVSFVRVGTLDEPGRFPPDVHIYVSSKLPWLALPAGAVAVPEYYDARELWPAASLARLRALRSA